MLCLAKFHLIATELCFNQNKVTCQNTSSNIQSVTGITRPVLLTRNLLSNIFCSNKLQLILHPYNVHNVKAKKATSRTSEQLCTPTYKKN